MVETSLLSSIKPRQQGVSAGRSRSSYGENFSVFDLLYLIVAIDFTSIVSSP
jgi:hypothetical protein